MRTSWNTTQPPKRVLKPVKLHYQDPLYYCGYCCKFYCDHVAPVRLPYTVFQIKAEILDDWYDEPRAPERLEEAFRLWLKTQKLKGVKVSVKVVKRGQK